MPTGRLVFFRDLKNGDAFITHDGCLGIKGQKEQSYDHAAALVLFPNGRDATLAEYAGSEQVEPVEIEITVTRRGEQVPPQAVESRNLTYAEVELAQLPGGKIPAIKSYRNRTGVGLREAKEKVA